jgi:predicted DsbA family dithiol-disulfide isomerase
VAERSSLVRLQAEYDIEVEWVGYELHPDTPRGGVPLASYLPDPDAMLGYVKRFAAGFGIRDLRSPERLASTRRALAAAQYAREAGKLEAFRAAAFDAYWREGRDLDRDEDLAHVASAAGLDPGAALAAAGEAGALSCVDAARRAAQAAGVTGVPTFDFALAADARPVARVVGCQPYEVLADAARRAGARPRRALR